MIPFRKSSSGRFVLILRTNQKESEFSLVFCSCFSKTNQHWERKSHSRRDMQDSREEALHVPLLKFFWFHPFFILIFKGTPMGKCLISAALCPSAGQLEPSPGILGTLTRARRRYRLLINPPASPGEKKINKIHLYFLLN